MTELVVETPEGLTLRQEIAGAGSRTAAGLIDAAIWAVAWMTLLLFAQIVLQGVGGVGTVIATGALLSLIGYQVLFAVFWNGQTPGKRVLGLHVVEETGLPATPVQHFLRGMFWPFEALIPVPVPFGIVLMAATPRHQRLGDRVAGTLVVRETSRQAPREILKGSKWSELRGRRLELVPAHAARFDGGDVDFLRELIGRTEVGRESRSRLLRRAAVHYLKLLELPLDPEVAPKEARALLSEIYLFLRETRTRD